MNTSAARVCCDYLLLTTVDWLSRYRCTELDQTLVQIAGDKSCRFVLGKKSNV